MQCAVHVQRLIGVAVCSPLFLQFAFLRDAGPALYMPPVGLVQPECGNSAPLLNLGIQDRPRPQRRVETHDLVGKLDRGRGLAQIVVPHRDFRRLRGPADPLGREGNLDIREVSAFH